ncbi:MAG: CARDB domain-containing protein, partial [Candidatus Cloacimonadaceae bacterium]|nr:CARDB domain-containing protein [Candidatus Cloacimonadaceae bacterium]
MKALKILLLMLALCVAAMAQTGFGFTQADPLDDSFSRFTNDLAITSFAGSASPYSTVSHAYQAIIQNQGSAAQNVYTVRLFKSGGILLDEVTGSQLGPGEFCSVFLYYTPELPGQSYLYATVDLAGDQNPQNNTSEYLPITILDGGFYIFPPGAIVQERVPADVYWKNSLYQCILCDNEVYYNNMVLTSIRLYNDFQSNVVNKPLRIWLGNTSQTDLSAGWIPADQMSQVFDGMVSFPNGQNMIDITFTEPYYSVGNQNLVMMVQRLMDYEYFSIYDTFMAINTYSNRSRKVFSDTITYDPYNPPAGATISGMIPKIGLFGSVYLPGNISGTVTDP